MRIGRAHGRLVIIDGDGVVDVAAVSGGEFGADPDRVFAVWDRFTEWAGRYVGSGARTGPLVPGELGAPVLTPAQVFGIGLNYRAHAAESGVDVPDVPPVFTKFRSCLAGPFAAVELPSDRVDWEVDDIDEVGRGATAMLEGHPERHVWGLGRHHIGSNFFWYLKDPVGNFSEYYSDLDVILDDQLWKPSVVEGARGLYNWGPPPPPSFIHPEDLAALMTGSHAPKA